jgi:hypothetical protein
VDYTGGTAARMRLVLSDGVVFPNPRSSGSESCHRLFGCWIRASIAGVVERVPGVERSVDITAS